MLAKTGEEASSKSAMKTLAPELSALTIILRSTGPVISTRRSSRSAGIGATFQSPSRTDFVSARKSGARPASNSFCRSIRRASSSSRRALNLRCSPARNVSASTLRISSKRGPEAARSSTPGNGEELDMKGLPAARRDVWPCVRQVCRRRGGAERHKSFGSIFARVAGMRAEGVCGYEAAAGDFKRLSVTL